MADTVRVFLGMCWDILDIELTLFEYTFTLRQVLFFSIISYAVALLTFDLIFDRFGRGGDGEGGGKE